MKATTDKVSSIGFAKRTLPIAADMVLLPLMWFVELYLMSYVNINAIAVFGLVAQIVILAFTFFFTLNVGSSIIILKYKQTNNKKDSNMFFSHTVIIAVYFSLFIGLLFYLFIPFFTSRLGNNTDTIYFLKIVSLSLPFMGFNFIVIGLLRSCGEGEKSFTINLIITLANLIPIFSYFYIKGKTFFAFHGMKIAGFSLLFSSVLGSVIIIILMILNFFEFRINVRDFIKLKKDVIKAIFVKSFYLGSEQILWASGQTYLTILAAYFSPVILAAHNIVRSIQSLVTMIYQGIGVSFFVHYNETSEKLHLFKKVLKHTAIVVLGISVFLLVFNNNIIRFFINSTGYNKLTVAEFVKYIKLALFIMLTFQIFKAFNIMAGYGLKQIDQLKWLLLITVISTVIFVFLGSLVLIHLSVKPIAIIWIIIGADEIFKAVLNGYRFKKEVA